MKTRMEWVGAAGKLTGAVALFASASASAATLTVGGGASPCPEATYASVQSAVDAAAPHDTIEVCAGTYTEQITVPAGKDGLVLRSREPLAAVLRAPAVMSDPGDIVRIHGAQEVTLQGFTIEGPLPNALFCSLLPRTGVRVDGGGSAEIRGNRITDVRSADPGLRGCQNGVPILVGSEPEGEIGSALVVANRIEAYQKNGIEVDNAGSKATVVGNVVLGDGPNAAIAQNGILIFRGAEAFVGNNEVSGQVYSPSPLASGILFYLSGKVLAVGNDVRRADFGIATVDVSGAEIAGNVVSACTAEGIDLDEEETGTTGAIVVENEARDNARVGIYVSPESKGNTVLDNRMHGNTDFDAEDQSVGSETAGTGNRWTRNRCKTDNHGGSLCAPE